MSIMKRMAALLVGGLPGRRTRRAGIDRSADFFSSSGRGEAADEAPDDVSCLASLRRVAGLGQEGAQRGSLLRVGQGGAVPHRLQVVGQVAEGEAAGVVLLAGGGLPAEVRGGGQE